MSGVEYFPAFPVPEIRLPDGTGIREGYDGMTLRDWFAGQALVSMGGWEFCAPSGKAICSAGERDQTRATRAYTIADAMLAERSKA